MSQIPKILIINAETGEEELRDMNAEELAQFQADKVADEAKAEEERAKATAKADLLERLGITEEEAQLLLA